MQLKDTVVLLTGASRGLGRALALALATRGARVACLARESDALAEIVSQIEAEGGRALAVPHDLAQLEATASQVERVQRELGDVGLLICNAGSTTVGEARDLDTADFEADLRVNFLAAVALTRAVLPQMESQGHGTLAYVLSGAALRPLPGWSAYSAAKAALGAYAGGLRTELAPIPVRVTTIFPGAMDTEFLARMRRVGERPRFLTPARTVAPARVAEAVVRALEGDRERLFLRGPAWAVHHVDHFVPAWVDRLLARRFEKLRSDS